MRKSPPAPLVIPDAPKKGEATPAMRSFEERAPAPSPELKPKSSRLSSRLLATIAVTVRLDETRYERMKQWGTEGRRVTNQEIIVAALDGFFALSDEEREEAILTLRQ
jgi:hypothetical protein